MNKSTNNVDIDKFKVDKKTQIKVVFLSIIACIVCGLMAVWLFGNGEGLATTFVSEESFSDVVFVQKTDGENSKATRSAVSFVLGDELSVYHDGVNGKEEISSEIENGRLVITMETSKNTLPDFFESDSSNICVTIPKDMEIENFIIEAELLNVEIDGFFAENFKITGDEITSKITNSNFENSTFKVENGNIGCYDTKLGKMILEGGTTNPIFKNCTFADVDMNIKFGNLLVQNSSLQNVKIVADLGYVDFVSTNLLGNFETYADYGAVSLEIAGDPSEYILKSYISESGKYNFPETLKEGKDETLKQLTITTYIGDINVSFS